MNQQVSVIQKTNWNRGLHRVFAIMWVLWLGFIFIWVPLQSIHNAQEFAASSYSYDKNYDSMSKEEKEAKHKENWKRATWLYAYKTEIIPNIGFVISAAVLVPPVVYLIIRGFIMLIIWLYRGFKAP